jgi:hypothetical protein
MERVEATPPSKLHRIANQLARFAFSGVMRLRQTRRAHTPAGIRDRTSLRKGLRSFTNCSSPRLRRDLRGCFENRCKTGSTMTVVMRRRGPHSACNDTRVKALARREAASLSDEIPGPVYTPLPSQFVETLNMFLPDRNRNRVTSFGVTTSHSRGGRQSAEELSPTLRIGQRSCDVLLGGCAALSLFAPAKEPSNT